ncbi:hypothetical protein ES332_D01G183000v1 [Gossypium tomentosum]|uniref:Uncharacterized protein n=1 Tax=Gossypium tomentosum TaxID=34277 RepID=A0A5D2MAL6_GOSTO|nr:hypothetical protein ES332_D01G183000v1 [Gossypium tomentosum]
MHFSNLFSSTSPIFCVLVSFAVIFTHESSCTSWIIPLLLPLCKYISWSSLPPPLYERCGCIFFAKALIFRLSLPTKFSSAFSAKEKGGFSLILSFSTGCITVHSWRSCPNFPQPKQNFNSFSYLKGIQYLFPLSLKTNIPLRRGFCTFNLILRRQNSPLISNLRTPPKVTPMACKRSFLSNPGKHGPILIQNGDETSLI